MVDAFRRALKQYHSQLNKITDAPWFCGDTTWYWKENFPHAYEAIYGNYQNNVLANIIFVDFQQQGERGLTNVPDEDPDEFKHGILRFSVPVTGELDDGTAKQSFQRGSPSRDYF